MAVDTTRILCQHNQINNSGISKELIIAILKEIYPIIAKKKIEYLSCSFLKKRIDIIRNNIEAAINEMVISDLNCVTVIKVNKRRNPKLLKKLLITLCLSLPNSAFLKILPTAITTRYDIRKKTFK